MDHAGQEKSSLANLCIGTGAGILLGAEVLLWLRIEWIRQFFYEFAWWSYILILEGLIHRKCGESLILSHPRFFLRLSLFSIPWWLCFELLNLRLENWKYLDLPSNPLVRWPGYAIAYATVLPALHQTACLLESLGLFSKTRSLPFAVSSRGLRMLQISGWACLILALIWPRYFFPLVWGSWALLLDPPHYRRGLPSLLREWSEGRPARALQLLLAGGICGILWEFWNFWAQAKWIYRVPYVGNWKIFEMPALGYLGFFPFAWECACFITWMENTWAGLSRPLRLLASVLLAVFSLAAFHWIDRNTVQGLVTSPN